MPPRRATPDNATTQALADFQRQIDQFRQDNEREHGETKHMLGEIYNGQNAISKLVGEHDITLYGKENEGGLVRTQAAQGRDLMQSKLGAALGLLSLLAGSVVAKVVGWI